MAMIRDESQQGLPSLATETDLPFFNAVENQYWRSMRGFLAPEGARMLYRCAYDSDPEGAAIEIGSLAGKSTVCISRALRDSKEDARLTAIDIRFQADFATNLEWFGLTDRVDAIEAPSLEPANGWARKLSFIYIDGSHAKALAFADLIVWDLPLMVGGVMALDDTFGFCIGPALQLQAAIRSGAYEPMGNFGGISFLKKKGPILPGIGDFPLLPGSLIAYVDYVGSWIGAMDLELRLPVGRDLGPLKGRRGARYIADRILDTSPRSAARWVARKIAARRAARSDGDPRARFITRKLVGSISILDQLEAASGLDEQACATIAYLRACLEIQELRPGRAIEILGPLCDLGAIRFPHYEIEVRQLAMLRLAQAYDLAGARDQAEKTYRRLTDGETIDEIRHQAAAGLSRPFQLPEPRGGRALRDYAASSGLYQYRLFV